MVNKGRVVYGFLFFFFFFNEELGRFGTWTKGMFIWLTKAGQRTPTEL